MKCCGLFKDVQDLEREVGDLNRYYNLVLDYCRALAEIALKDPHDKEAWENSWVEKHRQRIQNK